MWDFFETVRHRHSVRKYLSDMPVEPEKIHAILEMACAAPSAGDLQAYKIHVITDQKQRDELSQAAAQQNFISEAPIALVFCCDPERSAKEYGDRGKSLYALQDTTIAASYAQLASVAAGLGSAWVGSFDEQQVNQLLGLENDLRSVAIITIGYPAELPEPTPRRHLEDIVVYK
jgi:nitroreductase